MRSMLTLIKLKLSVMARRPIILVFCLVVPVLLSLLSGSVLERNDLYFIEGGYVDLADNRASRDLITLLESSGLRWTSLPEADAKRTLAQGKVDGLLVIPADFGLADHPQPDATSPPDGRQRYGVTFYPGGNEIASDLVEECFSISALALWREEVLVDDLMKMVPDGSISRHDMRLRLKDNTDIARREGASLKFEMYGESPLGKVQIVMIPDFAVEILFLSIFSLLGSLMLADAATQRRLRSISGGFLRDYMSSLLALTIAGAVQLSLMVGLTYLILPGVTRPEGYWLVMGVFFLLMLAFGQLVSLIHSEQRFVPASLILFISALIGGTFIRLPSIFVERVGQYTPHGWAFAQMNGMGTTFPLVAVAAIGFTLLILAYFLQNRSRHLAG